MTKNEVNILAGKTVELNLLGINGSANGFIGKGGFKAYQKVKDGIMDGYDEELFDALEDFKQGKGIETTTTEGTIVTITTRYPVEAGEDFDVFYLSVDCTDNSKPRGRRNIHSPKDDIYIAE